MSDIFLGVMLGILGAKLVTFLSIWGLNELMELIYGPLWRYKMAIRKK